MRNYGAGVTRVLDPTGTQYLDVIWQQGRPPLDSELTLLQDIATDWRQKILLRGTPSGWLGNETNNHSVYITNPNWSNWFRLGRQRTGELQTVEWAVVNGWLVPVSGTRTGTPPGSPDDVDTWNVIAMDPPPSNAGDARVDFVFLEVWLARIAPNPSALNKPSVSGVYKYGNVEGGFSFLADDIMDPSLGFETTERVQLQYRIRVVKGLVGLSTVPDGFDPTVVFGQGAATSSTTFTFTNMRKTLGDPGLWRAGDGTQNTLGTVDGYTYAIPMTAVFRRNSAGWAGDPSPNLNGGFNRNPLAVDRTGILTFTTSPTLAGDLSATATTASISSSIGIPLPTTPASPVLLKIGDEYLTYTALTGTTLTGLTRGVNGTRGDLHRAGSTVTIVASRPDNLFSDQITGTDLYDLRHLVNPNGFDYRSMLQNSLDKLLRGALRTNWKRSGSGPQGTFFNYQDKISASTPALGVTKLDAPDNIRRIFSDAAVIQRVDTVIQPTGTTPPASVSNTGFSLGIACTQTTQGTPSRFSAGDVIRFPVSSLKSSLPGGDADQVRWIFDGNAAAVSLRIDGQNTQVPTNLYTVTGSVSSTSSFGPTDDLVITFAGGFPQTANQIYVTLHAQYGAGRGLSRRATSLHNTTFVSPNTDLLLNPVGAPSTNFPVSVGWAPLYSRYRNATYKKNLPVTTSVYADLGSKTIIVSPFRRIIWPTTFVTLDGTSANVSTTAPVVTSTTGVSNNTANFIDTTASPFLIGMVGNALQISNGLQPGRYTVVAFVNSSQVTLDRAVPAATNLSYTVTTAQGLMPTKASDGITSKWTTTDPLGLFSASTDTSSPGFANTKNVYVHIPRGAVPNWGEFDVPILHNSGSTFSEGINFMLLSTTGASPAAGDANYVAYTCAGGFSYALFSTTDFATPVSHPASFNTSFTPSGGLTYAGIRFFTDSRGLNRQGLEFPPFYGISRLFAVYEAGDYALNGSAYNATDRTRRVGGATNLLRQDTSTATFWVEIDVDGDSTFVLNADVVDISRSSVNPISSFASGNYVIEANIFGFDRGSFDITKEFKLVLTRARQTGQAGNQSTRTVNIGASIAGPTSVLPGPATATDTLLVNYSRIPYQGDPWGSQTTYIDSGQTLGPLQTATAFQLASTSLTESALTRPNQKALEVLATIGAVTSLGTGRLSGDTASSTAMDFRNVGYEDPTVYPPSSGVVARPNILVGALSSDTTEVGTQYLGATERLPLGALWRDKDFRGGQVGLASGNLAPLVYISDYGEALLRSNLTQTKSLDQTEVPLDTANTGTGTPGDLLALVDGEPSNYSLTVNFRVLRGGSLFMVNGAHSGGEFAVEHPSVTSPNGHSNVVQIRAFLVRNAVTSVGASEVSSGDELMMLVATNVMQLKDTSPHGGAVFMGTNGSNEGNAAADLYRVEGHPLMTNNVHLDTDPSTITLSRRTT